MSIASEITRINGNIASAYTAASNKGATLPATQNSANLATCIASISGGGGGSVITATNTTGSAVSAGDKVWITPNGAGYDIVNLTKLKRDFQVVGSPTIDDTTGIVSNINNSNFIVVNKYLNSKYVEMYIKLYPTSIPDSCSILKSAENDYSALFIQKDTNKICFFDGVSSHSPNYGTFVGHYSININSWTWIYFKSFFNNGNHIIDCRAYPDNNYTLSTLPPLSSWQSVFNYTYANGPGTDQYMFNIGNYEYGFVGSVDLKNTIIKDGPNNNTIVQQGINYNGVIWQPYTEVSNLQSTSFSGYAAENIASGSSGQVMIQASGA